jgi:ribosomal protein S18 acetylase RimI-like enzyme
VVKDEPSFFDRKTLYLDDLCVDESARGRHVGSILYNAVLEHARKLGCHNVTLHVWECNPSARKFYEAMGMKPMSTTMETVL